MTSETCRNKAAWDTKRREHGRGFVWSDSHGKVGAEEVQKVRTYTSDDVDSSQAVECAHQLSVGFFTLHSTFLLQRLEELLHRHGAVGETCDKDALQKPSDTNHAEWLSFKQAHMHAR